MLFWLGTHLGPHFGPARLLTSRMLLGGLGAALCFVATFRLIPRLKHLGSVDRGREHAIDAEAAAGKPTGTGVIFVPVFVAVQLLCLPLSLRTVLLLVLMLGAMTFGFLDDRASLPWNDYRKGLADIVLAAAAAITFAASNATTIWLPFVKDPIHLPWVVYVAGGTVLIWVAINTVNCTDGVDGLSATLSILALSALGTLLYLVLGNERIARYLLLPLALEGALWGMAAFSLAGTLLAYLWFNAYPSVVLMGDAGSRAIGFLLGVLVIATGNPFLLLVVSGVVLLNGGTGLVKVALLRFGKISIFGNVRFPLHDHVRHRLGWSNTQVLVRFAVIQVVVTAALLLPLLKLR